MSLGPGQFEARPASGGAEDPYAAAFKREGFLAPELVTRVRQLVRRFAAPWFELGEDLSRLGQNMYLHCSDHLYGRSTHDPLALLLQMMPRALGAFQGALILAERGMVPEARTLIRGLYEAAIWAEYLRLRGETAVEHFEADTLDGQRRGLSLARTLFDEPERGLIETRLKEIEGQLAQLARMPSLKAVAEAAGPGALLRYQTFKDLSGEAAHVTLHSLDTYLGRSGGEEGQVHHSVGPDYDRVPETMLLGCDGLFAVLEQLRLMADHTWHDEEFRRLYDRHRGLSDRIS